MTVDQAKRRLEHLRGELRAERISYGELAELQDLAEYIDPGDVELLQAIDPDPDPDPEEEDEDLEEDGAVIEPPVPMVLRFETGDRVRDPDTHDFGTVAAVDIDRQEYLVRWDAGVFGSHLDDELATEYLDGGNA